MPKPAAAPNPISGLANAWDVAAEQGLPRIAAAETAWAERFAGGHPPTQDEPADASILAALPEDLDAALAEWLGHAPDAPGVAIAAPHFPHTDDFPSLATEILFGGTPEV